MTVNAQENQENTIEQTKQNDKELNFRRQQEMYERKLEQERQARLQLEQEIKAFKERQIVDDDHSDEPYVDQKTLEKKLARFENVLEQKIEKKAEEKARYLLDEEKKQSWLRNNPDFYDIMSHAQAFAERDPELAETILQMPESFERQKLVYKNIKALGLHKKPEAQPSIQEIIEKNRKSPYYQPSGSASPPYASAGDFSPVGQKNAYDKMQELKSRLRL